jgi:hypothetical protein
MGHVAGIAIAQAAQLMDGIVVIGGGISASAKFFMPALLEEMRGTVKTLGGDVLQRVQMKVYNLDDEAEFEQFARGEARELIKVEKDLPQVPLVLVGGRRAEPYGVPEIVVNETRHDCVEIYHAERLARLRVKKDVVELCIVVRNPCRNLTGCKLVYNLSGNLFMFKIEFYFFPALVCSS